MIVADKAASLEKLERYIDAEVLQAMGVPAAAGHSAAEGLRPPTLGAIAARENVHFYLMAFARDRADSPPEWLEAGGRLRKVITPKPTSGWTNEAIARSKTNTRESTSTFSSPDKTPRGMARARRRAHPLARRAKRARNPLRRHHARTRQLPRPAKTKDQRRAPGKR